jgi:Ca2+/Na+ antiporter
VSYGYVLYFASNLIAEGSELLLLVPSMAGLVGGVVLPLLGAVPDGAIILFSGLGGVVEEAQETLSVGVGALAGSTIMLLTVPFAFSVYGGRVDVVNGQPNYLGKPKLTEKDRWTDELLFTGVTLTEAVKHGGVLMVLTTVPYFLIQVPALFLHGPSEEVAAGEHWWSLAGLFICLTGLTIYMHLQLKMSRQGEDRDKRMAVVKKLLRKGKLSLSGAVASEVRQKEGKLAAAASSEYQSLEQNGIDQMYPPPAVAEYLTEVLADAFRTYDHNGDGQLDKLETQVFFKDFHETISEEEMDDLFEKFDTDKSGYISIDEFIGLAYQLIKSQDRRTAMQEMQDTSTRGTLAESAFADVEEEEVPEEFTDLTPDQQQAAIKKRAFVMLSAGALLVLVFSDPMVDVLQEIAVRCHVSPFYVSFILAPLASNASEVISSMYYASKKTRKTITVSLTALEGAACMNNTFGLSIFMGLIFFRGLAWQYTAETIAIIAVEVIIAIMVQSQVMTTARGVMVLSIFPLSILLVAVLEYLGFD